MCNKYKSHHLKEGRSITGCVKTARGAASEDLQRRAKIIMTSEVPEGDLSFVVTAKAHHMCTGKTCSCGAIASLW